MFASVKGRLGASSLLAQEGGHPDLSITTSSDAWAAVVGRAPVRACRVLSVTFESQYLAELVVLGEFVNDPAVG